MEVFMANDTKERILVAALEMFSQNGYAGTNIRELSASLGLVKSGVYKHFDSSKRCHERYSTDIGTERFYHHVLRGKTNLAQ